MHAQRLSGGAQPAAAGQQWRRRKTARSRHPLRRTPGTRQQAHRNLRQPRRRAPGGHRQSVPPRLRAHQCRRKCAVSEWSPRKRMCVEGVAKYSKQMLTFHIFGAGRLCSRRVLRCTPRRSTREKVCSTRHHALGGCVFEPCWRAGASQGRLRPRYCVARRSRQQRVSTTRAEGTTAEGTTSNTAPAAAVRTGSAVAPRRSWRQPYSCAATRCGRARTPATNRERRVLALPAAAGGPRPSACARCGRAGSGRARQPLLLASVPSGSTRAPAAGHAPVARHLVREAGIALVRNAPQRGKRALERVRHRRAGTACREKPQSRRTLPRRGSVAAQRWQRRRSRAARAPHAGAHSSGTAGGEADAARAGI
jgi:hypothetical protein